MMAGFVDMQTEALLRDRWKQKCLYHSGHDGTVAIREEFWKFQEFWDFMEEWKNNTAYVGRSEEAMLGELVHIAATCQRIAEDLRMLGPA